MSNEICYKSVKHQFFLTKLSTSSFSNKTPHLLVQTFLLAGYLEAAENIY